MYDIHMEQFEIKEKIKDAVRHNKLSPRQRELYNEINQWVFSNLKDNLHLNAKFSAS